MTARRRFRGLACGTHARNMRRSIAPYSYGLAARARRIYNDVACSGGQGVRSSRRTLPLEATRPGLLGTPGLVYSSSPAADSPLRDASRAARFGRMMRYRYRRAVAQHAERHAPFAASSSLDQRVECAGQAAGPATESSRESCRSNSWYPGKTCRGRSVPDLGDFELVLRRFGSLERRNQRQRSVMIIKIVMIQRLFKFSLS